MLEEKGTGVKKERKKKTKGWVNEEKEGGEEERTRPSKAQSAERGSEWKQQREQTASPPSAQGGLPGHGGGHLISMKETRDPGDSGEEGVRFYRGI